jgi:anti-sigma regulatory factor (Ser/Thr protein kinase)
MPEGAGAIPADPAARDHSWPNRWPRHDSLELRAIPEAIGCARARMREVLREWGLAGLAPDAEVVLAELATNALRAIERLASEAAAEQGIVRMWMLGGAGRLMLAVWDPTPWPPVVPAADVESERGRGLAIVQALAARWQWYYPARPYGGKVVWALLGSVQGADGGPCGAGTGAPQATPEPEAAAAGAGARRLEAAGR